MKVGWKIFLFRLLKCMFCLLKGSGGKEDRNPSGDNERLSG